MPSSRKPVPQVIRQHADDSLGLYSMRSALVYAPHVKLSHLGRVDERLAANLDGLLVAGKFGTAACRQDLATAGPPELMVAAVLAIEARDMASLAKLFALAECLPELCADLTAAFSWVSGSSLRGVIRELMACGNALQRMIGLAACVAHQVDPGTALDQALADEDVRLRAYALRAAGECGISRLRPELLRAVADDMDADCRFWAARSAIFLGDRDQGTFYLERCGSVSGTYREMALQMVLKVLRMPQVIDLLKSIEAGESRALIAAAGVAGDCMYIPWLMEQLDRPKLSRIAGESFASITGVDLAFHDLSRQPPKDDESVGSDEDEGLPWPDPGKVRAWWDGNQHRFRPGVRYFMGEPPSVAHCIRVLREGYQRQRIAAAQYLCLLQPGTRLFPTSAPAWRQQRWLKQMES